MRSLYCAFCAIAVTLLLVRASTRRAPNSGSHACAHA